MFSCRFLTPSFPISLNIPSQIIIYHNEAFSVLVRMINGILRYSQANMLTEIILYDDFSESELIIESRLKEYAKLRGGQWAEKVKFFRANERQGLIRAKAWEKEWRNNE
jgi:polypeptide N-acetylgalactosaminyltransferase